MTEGEAEPNAAQASHERLMLALANVFTLARADGWYVKLHSASPKHITLELDRRLSDQP